MVIEDSLQKVNYINIISVSFEVDANLISKKSVTMMNDTPAVMH